MSSSSGVSTTDAALPADLKALEAAFDAIERDAHALMVDLTPEQGAWRPHEGAWSIAECFDHLATANRVYVAAMQAPAEQALRENRTRRGPAQPGLIGGWFVSYLEPPARPLLKSKAPSKIRPRTAPPLADAFAAFLASHAGVLMFLRTYAGIDLAGTRFPNPFIRGVHFSLATDLHVLAAHERRHLWQARNVRNQSLIADP